MKDVSFFTNPENDWQRRYEALRASFVERLFAKDVAARFGYSTAYVHLLRHQFRHGKIDFSEPVPEGKAVRRRVTSEIRRKIREWREHRLSAGEITELLCEDGVEISVRTVERVLAEEGFPKLPRRTRLQIGLTVKGAKVPERSELVSVRKLDGKRFECAGAGIFLFAQDAETKLILYTAADIKRDESSDQILSFLSFWKGVHRGVKPILIFDSRLTGYPQLSALASQGVKFITLRRRGKKMLAETEELTGWERIHIPHEKRKYPNPEVHESTITLRGYDGLVRQVIIRGNGHEKPAFMISNDFTASADFLVGNYARR